MLFKVYSIIGLPRLITILKSNDFSFQIMWVVLYPYDFHKSFQIIQGQVIVSL